MTNQALVDKLKKTPPNKAGFFITGIKTNDKENPNALKYVVAPYTEGRFGENTKHYVIPKGAIDDGETVLHGGGREAGEETGIRIFPDKYDPTLPSLFTQEQYQRILNGEEILKEASGYTGVTINYFDSQALYLNYTGRADIKHEAVMFHVDVTGIENLRPHLKNLENANSAESDRIYSVIKPVRTDVLSNKDEQGDRIFPSFKELMEIFRTMKMPEAPWAKGSMGKPLFAKDDDLPPEGWFAALEEAFKAEYVPKQIATNGIEGASDWQNFLSFVAQKDAKNNTDYLNVIYREADAIKVHLKNIGLLGNDNNKIKFDTKDCPGLFYQEGADIIRLDSYLESCISNAAERSDFSRAFCGDTANNIANKAAVVDRISGSQMAAVVWAAGKDSIDRVATRYQTNPDLFPKTRGFMWGAPVRRIVNNDEVGARNLSTNRPLTETLGDDLNAVLARAIKNQITASDVAGIEYHGRTKQEGQTRQVA